MMKSGHLKSIAGKFINWKIAREYEWVHDWLDGCVAKGISLKKHRQYRHHKGTLGLMFFKQTGSVAFARFLSLSFPAISHTSLCDHHPSLSYSHNIHAMLTYGGPKNVFQTSRIF
jgi:hypothetical protein